jgi:hypothetical protein
VLVVVVLVLEMEVLVLVVVRVVVVELEMVLAKVVVVVGDGVLKLVAWIPISPRAGPVREAARIKTESDSRTAAKRDFEDDFN